MVVGGHDVGGVCSFMELIWWKRGWSGLGIWHRFFLDAIVVVYN